MPHFPILITDVTRSNLAEFLEAVRGCWKASSLLWMQANGFPVLPGVIVNGWTRDSEVAVAQFCDRAKFTELLLRIEKPDQRWTTRRGGYTVPVSALADAVKELRQEGMLAILLEPATPYSDLYSLASACDLRTGLIDVEVVGPGFDASDILRSDLGPHERFEIFVETEPRFEGRPDHQIWRSFLIENEAYRVSAQRRLAKIGGRLQNPGFPERVLQIAKQESAPEQLCEEAVDYLQRSGQTLLLDHVEKYDPIPQVLLEAFIAALKRLLWSATRAHVPWREFAVAASILEPTRLVMWDFYSPGDDRTEILSTMTTPDVPN